MNANSENLRAEIGKLKSNLELAARISHEMNQPLTGILGICHLITEQIDEAHPLFDDIQQIKKQAERLEQLVSKFQSAALLETGE